MLQLYSTVLFIGCSFCVRDKTTFKGDITLGFLRMAWHRGGGGGGLEVPAAHNSKTILNENEMKFGRIVENHKLISLVSFNCHMIPSLSHNNIITVHIWSFYKNLANQSREV